MISLLKLVALMTNVDPSLLYGICKAESNLTNVSGDGGNSIGYCQVTEAAANHMNKHYKLGWKKVTKAALWDRSVNLLFASLYIKYQSKRYDTLYCTVSAYNAGRCIQSNSNYVIRVLKFQLEYKDKHE